MAWGITSFLLQRNRKSWKLFSVIDVQYYSLLIPALLLVIYFFSSILNIILINIFIHKKLYLYLISLGWILRSGMTGTKNINICKTLICIHKLFACYTYLTFSITVKEYKHFCYNIKCIPKKKKPFRIACSLKIIGLMGKIMLKADHSRPLQFSNQVLTKAQLVPYEITWTAQSNHLAQLRLPQRKVKRY